MAKPKMIPESEETPADEAAESPEVQKKEAAEGTEEHGDQTGDAAIPEDFQSQATSLIESCPNDHCLTFLRSLISKKEDEMRKAEMEKEKPAKGKKIQDFSAESMPEL